MKENHQMFAQGFRDAIPVSLGYLAISFTFGILTQRMNIAPLVAVVISATNLTSAGQFAGLGIIATGGALLEMALTQLVINSRYLLMSTSLSQRIPPETSLLKRAVMAMGVTDEIFGLAIAVPGRLNPYYTIGCTCCSYPGWVLGTLLGVISSQLLPEAVVSALGVALYGMLIAVIVPPAKQDPTIALLVIVTMGVNGLSSMFSIFNGITPGLKIIFFTVIITSVVAVLRPVEVDR